jgi:Tol biopolymer transport system component
MSILRKWFRVSLVCLPVFGRSRPQRRKQRLNWCLDALEDRRVLNAIPVLVNNTGLQVTSSGTTVLTTSQLLATDADNTAAELTFKLTNLPTSGTLKLNNVALTNGQSFTQQDVNNGNVTYTYTSGQPLTDTFSFRLTDGATIAPVSRVSLATDGTQGNGDSSAPAISASSASQIVAYSSAAANLDLAMPDTNLKSDIFVTNVSTGATKRITVNGQFQGNGSSTNPSVSPDGRYVVYQSAATNLLSTATTGTQLFLYDGQSNTTTLLTKNSAGTSNANGSSTLPSFSADGRFIVFQSTSTNLISGDTNGKTDIYTYNMSTQAVTRVSLATDGTQGNGNSYNPAISKDGTYVAYTSFASNFVTGDGNGFDDVFLTNTVTKQTICVSVDANGVVSNGYSGLSGRPAITADGNLIVFDSNAKNLIPGSNSSLFDLYEYNVTTKVTTRVSNDSSGNELIGTSSSPVISSNGSYLYFTYTPIGTGAKTQLYVADQRAGTTSVFHPVASAPSLSADERFITFESTSATLVSGDTNAREDIFIEDIGFVDASTNVVVNDAPILDAAKTPVLTAVDEDAVAPAGAVGTLVSALVDLGGPLSNVNDPMLGTTASVTGIAVTAADATNGSWFYSTDDGATWSALGAVTATSARLLAANATTRLYFRPTANYNGTATLTFRAWDQTSGTAGTTVDTSTNGGASPFSTATDTADIVVNPVNDAPTLNASKSPLLGTIGKSAGAPDGAVGTLVSSLVDFANPSGQLDNVTDIDAGAVLGIAVIGADSTNGTWFYSTDDGANWSTIGSITSATAVLLNADAQTRLYFQPNSGFGGTATITFVAWDRSSGLNGDTVDATTRGGITPFSSTSDTALITVNEAPVLDAAESPTFPAVNEDDPTPTGAVGTLVSTLVDFTGPLSNVVDGDSGAVLGIAITAVNSTNGTWFFTTNGGSSWTLLSSATVATARLLSADASTRLYFKPNLNFNGAVNSALTFRAWDRTSGVNGGTADTTNNGGFTSFSTVTDTISLTVTAQNDAPVLDATKSPMLLPVLEDAAAPVGKVGTLVTQFVFGIGSLKNVADVDVGAQLGIAVTGASTSGTWYYSLDDGTNWSPLGSVSVGAARLLAADGMTRLYFKPNANINGTLAGVLAFQAWDRTTGINGGVANAAVNGGTSAFSATSDTATIVVTAVNDAPTLDATKSPALLPVLEDASTPAGPVGTLITNLARVSGSLKNVADNDVGALAGIAVTAADITQGTWYYSTNNGTAWSPLGTVAATSARLLAADAGTRIYFKPKLDYNGTLTAALTFRAWDQTTGVNGALANPGAGGGSTAYSTATDTASLVVTAVNDAPVLDTSKSPTLAPVTRNAGNPIGKVGTLIDALVHLSGSLKNVNDVDVGAKTGIAVTAASTSGTWFYSTNNGSTWAALGAVGTASAKLLAADGLTRLYFKPNLGFRGTIASAITFRAWDRTAGANGANANVGAGGLTTPYSKFADTASIVVA